MKGRIPAVLLILVLIVPVSATMLWLKAEREEIREKVQEMIGNHLEDEDLTRIQLSLDEAASELRWNNPKEFVYGSAHYDVVKTLRDSDSITFFCWEDEEETKLDKKLNRLLQKALGSDQPTQQGERQLTRLFEGLGMPESFSYRMIEPESERSLFSYHVVLKDTSPETDTPPPRNA